tara:strand:+ start:257 stop:1015 length:759 start_codon:yes stop_codon:yes gene_type:complete
MYPKIVNTLYGRFYEVAEGVFFPSISTITSFGTPLSFGIMKYIIKQSDGDYDKYLNNKSEALRVGTKAHDIAERLLKGEEITIEKDPSVQKAIISFTEWYNMYEPKVVATEKVLYNTICKSGSYVLPVAGRCDLVAEIKNKEGEEELWMIDFKTSKVPRDPRSQIQLTFYAWLWNLNNERKIDRLGIVALKKDFAGRKPGRTTKYMIEYKYNEELAMSAYNIFNAFYEAYDRKGNPKLKPVLATKFRLGEYE